MLPVIEDTMLTRCHMLIKKHTPSSLLCHAVMRAILMPDADMLARALLLSAALQECHAAAALPSHRYSCRRLPLRRRHATLVFTLYACLPCFMPRCFLILLSFRLMLRHVDYCLIVTPSAFHATPSRLLTLMFCRARAPRRFFMFITLLSC